MKEAVVKWAISMIMQEVYKLLTPERVRSWQVAGIAMLRDLAKKQTPDFPFDDELVEALAKALKVP